MNCKPGDLAIVIKSICGNEGKIVRCIRLATTTEADRLGYWTGPLWHIDVELMSQRYNGMERRMVRSCPDEYLRPIRDPGDDAVDEVIQRIGTPHKEVA